MANRSSEWNLEEEVPPSIPAPPLPKTRRKVKILYGFQRINSSKSSDQICQRSSINSSNLSKISLSCISVASGSASSTQSSSNYLSSPSAGSLSSSEPASLRLVSREISPSRTRNDCQETKSGYAASRSTSTHAGDTSQGADLYPQENTSHLQIQPSIPEVVGDDVSMSSMLSQSKVSHQANFDFWAEMPHEIALHIFAYLEPRQLIWVSAVSKSFYNFCYDGQLWKTFNASEFYTEIPADSLARILEAAGPFMKNINLRGCIQIRPTKYAAGLGWACHNLVNATLEGCQNLDSSSLHDLFRVNERLTNLNLTALAAVTNTTCNIISQSCPCLESLNISWCNQVDFRGVSVIVLGCKRLVDLRVAEIRSLGNSDLAQDLFETNNLERLILSGCVDFTDQALQIMMHGTDPEINVLTNAPRVPPRRLRHLDLSRCHRLTNAGVKSMAHVAPNLQGLQLSGCPRITNDGISNFIATTPSLTHLDLDELFGLTNEFLIRLSQSPCAPVLERLSVSYCDLLGDDGMVHIFRACTNLKSVDLDNTKISDLVLAEAASMVHSRSELSYAYRKDPFISLRLVVYDCVNVTWAGVREVLSHNLEIRESAINPETSHNSGLIGLKCFYSWQMTVDEHTKRLFKNDLAGASRLDTLWRDWMMASEETETEGPGLRRRLRRAREAQLLHDDEEISAIRSSRRRRRAWSSGCTLM